MEKCNNQSKKQDGPKRKMKIINSELICRSIEIIQSKQQGEKILKN